MLVYHCIFSFVQLLVQFVVRFDRISKVEHGWVRHCKEDRLCFAVVFGVGSSLLSGVIYAAMLPLQKPLPTLYELYWCGSIGCGWKQSSTGLDPP